MQLQGECIWCLPGELAHPMNSSAIAACTRACLQPLCSIDACGCVWGWELKLTAWAVAITPQLSVSDRLCMTIDDARTQACETRMHQWTHPAAELADITRAYMYRKVLMYAYQSDLVTNALVRCVCVMHERLRVWSAYTLYNCVHVVSYLVPAGGGAEGVGNHRKWLSVTYNYVAFPPPPPPKSRFYCG